MIKLTITRLIDNPDYEQEKKNHENQYINSSVFPRKQIEVEVLSSEIKEEQFEVMRKEVLKVF